MKNQTAVEWLEDQLAQHLLTHGHISHKVLTIHTERAKKNERKQIVDAYKKGTMDITGHESNGIDAEQHYNETYKGGDNE